MVRQSVPANIEILDGSIQSGAAGDLEYLDQKVVLLKSGVSDAGKNCVRLEALFTGVPKTRIQSATFRLGTVNAGSLTYTISLFDWNSNSYIEHNSTGTISSKGLNEINLINWSDCHIDDSANIKVEVTISAESPFELSLDQMQLLLLCEESVQNVEVRNYTVENAQIEQGTTVAGTTAKNLKDRDGASFQVKSSNKKAAWTTTVPLYYEKNDVQTIQVDYTGNTSEETNVIWLSLYRFDTQNWEVVGTIPESTEEVTRSFVLSGNGISAYISDEGDIQIRVYNSASKEFIRYTDCVSVTTVANSQSQQKVYTPTTFVEEYGSSEGQIEKLDHIDGQSMKFHSDNNRKSAVQFEFDTDIDIDTIGEVTFVVALKSKNGANTQNLSLKNVSTGKFAVVKIASSSDNYEMIRFTLDSLREIEQYIDANGKLTLRIYNSASSSVGDFTREIDFVQMSITYGRFTRFEVAQLSDVHELIGSENFKAIISEINSNIKPAFSIITGDISDHGTPAQYELYLQDKQLFDGQVYTTPGNHDVRWWNANVYVGSNDGNLYCIDLDTGYQKWCIQTGDFVISKPAITSEGNIVFGSGDEFVYCASANDGNVIWNTKLGGSVLSDPLTSEGRVFIGCGDGKIYCLNSASGEIVWGYQTDGLMRQRPILENGILYAFVRDTYIWYAIDASTGQLIWRGNANTDESLFVCGDVRPVIANGKLWCIDAQNTRPAYLSLDTGELAWTSTLEKVSSRGMTTNGSTVFYSSNSGRQITAFDAETNQVVWQKDLRYDNKDRDLQEMILNRTPPMWAPD